jgi:hypothetical protein
MTLVPNAPCESEQRAAFTPPNSVPFEGDRKRHEWKHERANGRRRLLDAIPDLLSEPNDVTTGALHSDDSKSGGAQLGRQGLAAIAVPDFVAPRRLTSGKNGAPAFLGNMRDQQPTRSQSLSHHAERRVVIGDFHETFNGDDCVVGRVAQAFREVSLRELDVADLRVLESRARPLEQLRAHVDADYLPVRMTARNGFREEPVPTSRIENAQRATVGEPFEGLHRQLKTKTSGRGEQAETPVKSGAG